MKNATTAVSALLALLCFGPAHANGQAVAALQDRAGQSVGEVRLTEGPNGILIHVSAKGLPPGPKAIHIH